MDRLSQDVMRYMTRAIVAATAATALTLPAVLPARTAYAQAPAGPSGASDGQGAVVGTGIFTSFRGPRRSD